MPVLRRKLAQVLAAAGLARDSYDGTDLAEILEDYPREELFEISAEELIPIALGVLRLSERKQTRLFLRRDRYGRYMSCLVYLPRDRYTTKVRLRAQGILREALHGVSVDYSATVGDSALARLYVVVRGEPGRPVPQVDAAALERKLAEAVRSWDEDLAAEAVRVLGEERASQVLELGARVPETYKADVTAADAVGDLTTMLALRDSGSEFAVRLVEHPERWTLVVYRSGTPITLSDVLPQLQHMGVEVVDEHPYRFTGSSTAGSFWIYEFGLRPPAAAAAGSLRQLFEDALTALWHGQTEDDGFNALVLTAGLTWREVTLLRACAKYLRQGGMRFSEDYVQRVLRSNGAITRLLIRLFESRFDPARQNGAGERCEAITEEIRGQLDEVTSLDADRILRSYLALIDATLRTSYYKQEGPRAPGPGVGRARGPWCSSSPPARCPGSWSRGPCSRSSPTHPGSRRCTCASAGWRAAGCAGPTGSRTSAPRCSAWSRRRRSRTPSSSRPAPRAASCASGCPTRPTARPTRPRCWPATRRSSRACST